MSQKDKTADSPNNFFDEVDEIYMLSTLSHSSGLQLFPNKFYKVGEDLPEGLAHELLQQRKEKDPETGQVHTIGPYAEPGSVARERMEKERKAREREQERLKVQYR